MASLVYYLFELILTSFLNFSPDTVHKNPRLTQTFTLKDIKTVPYNGNHRVGFNFLFVLLSPDQSLIFEKGGGKKNLV